ncbi:hypothetical protein ACFVHW_04535 [Streptomyces sp. NPDC127110]|uniref:hypothetical protein n=1 Tax=Streptomyces sp. NPDC127110 TaxID=3345362 RepID=UPI00363A4827
MPADLAEGEWNLAYDANGLDAGADLVFGTVRTGRYLLDPYEIRYADPDVGDTPMPRTDAIRLGQDYRAPATITFELGVDTVGAAATPAGRHAHNLNALSAMGQAWDAEALRRQFGAAAVLRTVQGGRARRFYGRPRKWDPAASRLTRQGYTPVTATFACVDATAYDDVEQSTRIDIQPPMHRGLVGPLRAPLTMTAASAGIPRSGIEVGGTKPAWPLITFTGPITQPSCTLVEQTVGGRRIPGWTVSLDVSLGPDQSVTIDPRPWACTVLRNDGASLAGKLTWDSPRLQNLRMPPGRQNLNLRGADDTGTASMVVSWRDAYSYL